ncbi:hypothetical protein [Nonomuraea typhae]|uniref:hypothetical protein n=1 Tax=Nonomuraea typhae TaxID=2603600 RepID=UPI0012F803A5|nr:hypothetical protein [Nonomuraea typhae]
MEWALTHGPVGTWRSALGTAGVLLGDEVHFGADGSGELRSSSVVFGEERLPFRWRMVGYAAVHIGFDDEERVVRMEFRRLQTDAGAVTVLAEPGVDAFWPADDPLELLSR